MFKIKVKFFHKALNIKKVQALIRNLNTLN